MKKPEMEIVEFQNEDVIATSDTPGIDFWTHVANSPAGMTGPYHSLITKNGDAYTLKAYMWDGEKGTTWEEEFSQERLTFYPGAADSDRSWYYMVFDSSGSLYGTSQIRCNADHEHMIGFTN